MIYAPFLRFLTLSILLSGCLAPRPSLQKVLPDFPESYSGFWEGQLNIYKGAEVVHTINMSLEIGSKTVEGTPWVITYKDGDKVDRRDYTLEINQGGDMQINENNGIILPLHRNGNRMISWFGVEGQVLLISYELKEKELVFRVDVSKDSIVETTGGGQMGGDPIPIVSIYAYLAGQTAHLKRRRP